jgi:hypothetical protein
MKISIAKKIEHNYPSDQMEPQAFHVPISLTSIEQLTSDRHFY